MVGLFLWSGNGFDTVFIDIPEVAADGAVPHTAEELHVGLHLEYIVGAWFAEFEIDDYGMAVFGHDAVGAAGYDLSAVRLPAEDAAFAKEGPRTVEPVAYLFVLPATLNDGAYVLQLAVVFNEPLLKECLQHLRGIIGRIDFGIDFVEQVALSDVLPAVVGISLEGLEKFGRLVGLAEHQPLAVGRKRGEKITARKFETIVAATGAFGLC